MCPPFLKTAYVNKSFSFSYKGHAPAYTAIGWYALNFQDNTVKAAKMFGIADRMGHRDASHNLGYMYKTGRYPGKQADQVSVILNWVLIWNDATSFPGIITVVAPSQSKHYSPWGPVANHYTE